MILDALLYLGSWFFTILWSPLSVIPDGTYLFGKSVTSIELIRSYAYGFDFILPVSEALLMIYASITIGFAISIFFAVMTLIRIIRGM